MVVIRVLVLAAMCLGAPSVVVCQDQVFVPRRWEVVPKKRLEGRVTAIAPEIQLLVISLGKNDGVLEGDVFRVYVKEGTRAKLAGRIIIDRADRKWSAGKYDPMLRTPRVGDIVVTGPEPEPEPLDAMLQSLTQIRPLKKVEQQHIGDCLMALASPSIGIREEAFADLVALGPAAWNVLREVSARNLDHEVRARIEDLPQKWGISHESLLLSRDVVRLSQLNDRRAFSRLNSIVGHLRICPGEGHWGHWYSENEEWLKWVAVADRYEWRAGR